MKYVLAGHNNSDPGAVATFDKKTYKEADLAKELRDLISKEMQCVKDNDDWNLNQTITWLKSVVTKSDVIVDIHFNAATPAATGTEVLVGSDAGAVSKKIATEVANGISVALSIKNRGVKSESDSARGRLGIFRTIAPTILIEVCFITNKVELETYLKNKENVAKSIANILKKY